MARCRSGGKASLAVVLLRTHWYDVHRMYVDVRGLGADTGTKTALLPNATLALARPQGSGDTGRAMSRENVEVVRRIYAAVDTDAAPAVLALFDPEVEWDTTPLGSEGITGTGVYRGYDGIREWFRLWNEAWADSTFDLGEVIEAGDQVVAVVTRRGRGRTSGVKVEAPGAVLWTIRAGRALRVVLFPTREDALEAVGLSE